VLIPVIDVGLDGGVWVPNWSSTALTCGIAARWSWDHDRRRLSSPIGPEPGCSLPGGSLSGVVVVLTDRPLVTLNTGARAATLAADH
jgi:hypothetical protein